MSTPTYPRASEVNHFPVAMGVARKGGWPHVATVVGPVFFMVAVVAVVAKSVVELRETCTPVKADVLRRYGAQTCVGEWVRKHAARGDMVTVADFRAYRAYCETAASLQRTADRAALARREQAQALSIRAE